MTQILTFRDSPPPPPPFATLPELYSTHNALLRKQREPDAVLPAGEVNQFILRACATGAFLDAESQRESTQALIDYWTATLFRAHVEPPPAALEDFNPMLAPDIPDDACPYVGLDAFREADTERFFGRQRLVDSLLASLRERRFVAVLGQSGSGKSSVVMGGVLPALRHGAIEGSEKWNYLPPIVPGSDPLRALAKLFSQDDGDALVESFKQDDGRLTSLVDVGDAPALLVIDQFEELFTLCDDGRTRDAFAANIAAMASSTSHRHAVVVTMRSDFDLQIARVPQLQPLFEDGRVYITPLSAGELRDAIEKPAALAGLKFEEGIVDGLIADTLGEPAALPLLQFSLLKLWDARQKNRVTVAAYKKLGGGRLALENTAENLFQSLFYYDKMIAKRILLRIVRVEFGTETYRNRIRKAELFRKGDNVEAIEVVLNKLIAARLIRFTPGETPADDQIEVAHESLVRNWPTLAKWLEEDRAHLKTLRHYEALANDWIRFERKSGLLDEAQLREAKEWLNGAAAMELGYSPAVAEFIEASERRIQEIAAEVQAQKRHRTAWTATLVVSLIVTLSALVLWFYTENKRKNSETAFNLDRANAAEKLAQTQREATNRLEAKTHELQSAYVELGRRQNLLKQQKEQEAASLKAAWEKSKESEQRARKSEQTAREEAKRLNKLLEVYRAVKVPERVSVQPEKPLPTSKELRLEQMRRPLLAGSSISDLDGEPRSNVCCVVHDLAGGRYLLGLQLVFSDVGKKIVQPAVADGGTEKDVIAVVTKVGKTDHSGTLAALIPQNLKMDPEVPEIGKLSQIAGDLKPGTKLKGIGSGSGIIRGTITKIDEEGDYLLEVSTHFDDIGAPAFTEDGRLAGLIVGGLGKVSWVIPIKTVLNGLNVELESPPPVIPEERIAESRLRREAPGDVLKLGERHRPLLQVGSSISEVDGLISSNVCCVVRDNAGTRYLLLMRMVFSDVGKKILQPAEDDGGSEPNDTIATVTKLGPTRRSGTLAKLEPNDLGIDPNIPDVGKISDLAPMALS